MVGYYVPTKVICVRNKDKPWLYGHCRRSFGRKREAHIRWNHDLSLVNWEQFVYCQVREAKGQLSDRNSMFL